MANKQLPTFRGITPSGKIVTGNLFNVAEGLDKRTYIGFGVMGGKAFGDEVAPDSVQASVAYHNGNPLFIGDMAVVEPNRLVYRVAWNKETDGLCFKLVFVPPHIAVSMEDTIKPIDDEMFKDARIKPGV